MANSVDPDETAHYESSHQDLHCLHMYLVWSAWLKWTIYSKVCIILAYICQNLNVALVKINTEYANLNRKSFYNWTSGSLIGDFFRLCSSFNSYLKDKVHQHFQSIFSGVFSCQICWRQVKQVGSCFIAESMNKHLLPCTSGTSQ